MSDADFYCDEVFSGRTEVRVVRETSTVLAFHHTKPSYPVHIVVVPKKHIPSLTTASEDDWPLVVETLSIAREVARDIECSQGRCSLVTNLGDYQDSKHLHWHILVR